MSTSKFTNQTYNILSLNRASDSELVDNVSIKRLIRMGGENVEEDWPIRANNPELDSAGIYPSFKKVFKNSPNSINYNQ